ncbi:HAD-superfamily hydrolase [Astrocystis sublimbata]|nr:HAD-superfamily hydrolase [Astrocystis sublimbata]
MAEQPGNKIESHSFAVACDVDGVFLRGKKLIPGWGMTEEQRAVDLGKRLGVDFMKSQIIQCHTPYRDLAPIYENKAVLVIGRGDIRQIAKDYGFKKVYTTSDFRTTIPHISQYGATQSIHENIAQISQTDLTLRDETCAAILVWNSPEGWYGDVNVILHVLWNSTSQVPLYFCNPDLVWATENGHLSPAQGLFCQLLERCWEQNTKPPVKYEMFGKPTQATFQYGEKALQEYNIQLNNKNSTENRIKTTYMIGDNPESDIKGCNQYISLSKIR